MSTRKSKISKTRNNLQFRAKPLNSFLGLESLNHKDVKFKPENRKAIKTGCLKESSKKNCTATTVLTDNLKDLEGEELWESYESIEQIRDAEKEDSFTFADRFLEDTASVQNMKFENDEKCEHFDSIEQMRCTGKDSYTPANSLLEEISSAHNVELDDVKVDFQPTKFSSPKYQPENDLNDPLKLHENARDTSLNILEPIVISPIKVEFELVPDIETEDILEQVRKSSVKPDSYVTNRQKSVTSIDETIQSGNWPEADSDFLLGRHSSTNSQKLKFSSSSNDVKADFQRIRFSSTKYLPEIDLNDPLKFHENARDTSSSNLEPIVISPIKVEFDLVPDIETEDILEQVRKSTAKPDSYVTDQQNSVTKIETIQSGNWSKTDMNFLLGRHSNTNSQKLKFSSSSNSLSKINTKTKESYQKQRNNMKKDSSCKTKSKESHQKERYKFKQVAAHTEGTFDSHLHQKYIKDWENGYTVDTFDSHLYHESKDNGEIKQGFFMESKSNASIRNAQCMKRCSKQKFNQSFFAVSKEISKPKEIKTEKSKIRLLNNKETLHNFTNNFSSLSIHEAITTIPKNEKIRIDCNNTKAYSALNISNTAELHTMAYSKQIVQNPTGAHASGLSKQNYETSVEIIEQLSLSQFLTKNTEESIKNHSVLKQSDVVSMMNNSMPIKNLSTCSRNRLESIKSEEISDFADKSIDLENLSRKSRKKILVKRNQKKLAKIPICDLITCKANLP